MAYDRDERFQQKKSLYDAFDQLNGEDDADDPGRTASEAAWDKACTKKPTVPQATATDSRMALSRSASESRFVTRDSQRATGLMLVPSSTPPHNQRPNRPLFPSALRTAVSDTAATTLRAPAKTIGKRKRDTGFKVVPEQQQIFNGLHFYFFPNNDTNPARRMRILKAREYGARWEKDWCNAITHVVLDNSMSLDLLLKYLKLECLPSNVVLIPEHYPAECISYRALLDPKHPQFAVKGYVPPPPEKIALTEPDKSLPLKAAGRALIARQPATPPREAEFNIANTAAASTHRAQPKPPKECDRVPDSFPTPGNASSREFDEAITQAKALQELPLDDEDTSRPSTSEGPDSGDDEKRAGLKLLNKQKSKMQLMQDRFQCMHKHTGNTSSTANLHTINILQQMANYYGQIGDEWRIRAYRKAIATLRNHPVKVSTKEEALALPNVGDRLAEKIAEIAATNHLRRLDHAKAEPADQALQIFMGVYGAGIVQVTKWVDAGYNTLGELLQKADLTANQRVGIEHYEDFNSRIPRAEVERHGRVVRDALQQMDSAFEVIIGGSYRRGSKDSGDIDLIITRDNTNASYLRDVVLGQLVPQLMSSGFLAASLAITSRDDGSKWHGASCLPGTMIWRRLDLLLVPSEEIGAALIYFTGNDIFNRSLRLLASTKGMRLNQRGLYRDIIRGKNRVKVTEGTLVEGKDEKKIFEVLGVPWRPPEHRVC